MDRGAWWATVHRVAKSWTQETKRACRRDLLNQRGGDESRVALKSWRSAPLPGVFSTVGLLLNFASSMDRISIQSSHVPLAEVPTRQMWKQNTTYTKTRALKQERTPFLTSLRSECKFRIGAGQVLVVLRVVLTSEHNRAASPFWLCIFVIYPEEGVLQGKKGYNRPTCSSKPTP